MKNNSIIRELRKIDKNTFRMLNGLFGYDFEKPFTVVKIKSPFTVGKCWKALQEKGYNPIETTAVVLMDSTKITSCWNKYTVTRITYNDFIVDYEVYRGCDGFRSVWDSFYRKGDFNERRKLEGVTAYVIAQNAGNMQHAKYDRYGYKEERVDFSDMLQRFTVDDVKKCRPWKGGDDSEYISNVVLSIKGSKIHDRTYGAYIDGDARNVKDLLQVIDKSGYLVLEKREKLKKRANALRKERAAAGFKATDNTAILNAVKDRIKALQADICKTLASATTSAQIDLCHELLSSWRGFSGLVYDFERLVKGETEKTFASVAAFNDHLHGVNSRIDNVAEMIKAATLEIEKERGVIA